MKKLKIVGVVVIVLVFSVFVRSYKNKFLLPPVVEPQSLLFTQYNFGNREIKVSKYNLATKEIDDSFVFTIPAPLAIASADQEQPVVYDGSNRLSYILLQNFVEMGERIINTQYPSKYLIAKADLANKTSKVIYQTDNYISQWLINPTGSAIYLFGQNKQEDWQLEKINLSNAQSEVLLTFPEGEFENENYLPLILSSDGNTLYQTINTLGKPNRKIVLRKIDLVTNTVNNLDIFTSTKDNLWPAETKTTISPDRKYLAFSYDNTIYFYDLNKTKVVSTCALVSDPNNSHLTWSGNSKEIFTLHEDGIQSCKLNNKNSSQIVSATEPYTIGNTQPGEYLLYSVKNIINSVVQRSWWLYDTKTNQSVKLGLSDDQAPGVVGISWE